jgi:hypothetical protein
LDGIYLPANPAACSLTELFVYAPEAKWSYYRNSEAEGARAAVDVYVLSLGAVSKMLAKPVRSRPLKLYYVRQLNPAEVAELEKIGRKRGLWVPGCN